jgi:hypothetical protein
MMEAASTSETSVNFNQTIRHYYPEDSHLHTRRREILNSNLLENGHVEDREGDGSIILGHMVGM